MPIGPMSRRAFMSAAAATAAAAALPTDPAVAGPAVPAPAGAGAPVAASRPRRRARWSPQERLARLVDMRFGMFNHFNMGTFTDEEWATPHQDPKRFAPPQKADASAVKQRRVRRFHTPCRIRHVT